MKRTTSFSLEISNENQEFKNENLSNTEVSSFKVTITQFIAVFPISFLIIRLGFGIGFTNILVSELSKNGAEINVTLNELTWFSSYCFTTPVGAISGGFLAQYVGAPRLLMFPYLMYIAADLLFYWANSVAMILAAQSFVGLNTGIMLGPSYSYIAEILQPKFRSVTIATMGIILLFGNFLSLLLGNFMYWRTQTFVSLVPPVIGFIFIHFIPDSPLWLASKNRFEDAEKSLARLRGWTTPQNVKAELHSSVMEKTPAKCSNSSKGMKLKETLFLIFDKSFYIPLLTMSAMFFFAEFNGANAMTAFSTLIFEEMKSPIDFHVATTINSALHLVAAFVYIFSVAYFGKRLLTLASVFIMVICLTIAATLLYLTKINLMESSLYSWIILITIVSTKFVNKLGIGKVIYFLNSELYPQKLRYVGSGVGYFIHEIMGAIFQKTFLYIVKAITYPGTLIIFIVINIISFIVIYLILPETEGVTLLKIEEHYAGKNKLKNKR